MSLAEFLLIVLSTCSDVTRFKTVMIVKSCRPVAMHSRLYSKGIDLGAVVKLDIYRRKHVNYITKYQNCKTNRWG